MNWRRIARGLYWVVMGWLALLTLGLGFAPKDDPRRVDTAVMAVVWLVVALHLHVWGTEED